ncbi:hypothetical protein CROQUDRAFT_89659 [Cronartium quercuum f. sp. fusiforme G11]|uniref:Uncharacterized protein n=1 Tax=Cronartium quercuum f. sp. fusiforme G11 TaxID=708437 RepID=A0A9P6NP21_9BASI|nr:hypothetical protein CROQUDRAFT_89659 [Cronartium quercuum f. sp. fusiforme G11]
MDVQMADAEPTIVTNENTVDMHFLLNPEDEEESEMNSEDEMEEIEEIPLVLDHEEVKKWYPFKKKEVC